MKFLAFIVLIAAVIHGNGQTTWTVSYDHFPEKKNKTEQFSAKAEADASIRNSYSQLLAMGFLDAELDTISQGFSILVKVTPGELYKLKSIEIRQDSVVKTRFDEYWKKPGAFQSEFAKNKANKVMTEFENRGYPFVSLQMEELRMNHHEAEMFCSLDPGPLITMDSLIFRSDSKIPQRYVRNYLDIKKGDLYDEEKIQNVTRRLREIPFVSIRQSPEIRFKPGKADLFLFLEKKKANYFNGVLGIRPDDKTGKVNFTGDVEVKLLNAFNSGEEIYLNWRKMQALTQDLTAKLLLPYLFNTPVGVDGQLKIYKRDSTFTSVKSSAGLVFNFGGMNRLKLFAEKNRTDQLMVYYTAQPLANVNSTYYGLAINYDRLDYRYNPRSGAYISLEGATGNRNVQNSNLITAGEIDETKRYTVYRLTTEDDLYIPTFIKQCIRVGVKSSLMITPSIFDNEMTRIGGLRTLRGIDEESINTTSSVIGTLEYRLLFEENSALYVFVDQGWYEKKSATSFVTDTPIGFGAGVNFETKAGIFTFNYAVGQQFDNPILVRNAKVSFGFRNIF